MDHKTFITMLCCLVPPTFLLFFFYGRAFARWKVIRVIAVDDSDDVRIRINLVTPYGAVLKEVTARGSSDVWWFEDDWGCVESPCSKGLSLVLKKAWEKELNS